VHAFLRIHHLVDVEILIVVGSDPENSRRVRSVADHHLCGVLMSATGSGSMPHNEIASTAAEA